MPPVFIASEILRQLRKANNLRSKDVCHGICDITTYSKIENGKQTPQFYTFAHLIERLGSDYRKFIIDVKDFEGYEEYKAKENITRLLKGSKFEEAKRELDTYCSKWFSADNLHMNQADVDIVVKLKTQFVISSEAIIEANSGGDIETIIESLLKAISLTIPDFTIDNINCYLLSADEMIIINSLANMYGITKEYGTAIRIYLQIKQIMELHYLVDTEKSNTYMITLYNLTKVLGLNEKYVEAIEYCDEALEYCKLNNSFRMLPRLLFNKAYCLFFLKNRDTCISISNEAYQCARAHGDIGTANAIKKWTQDTVGITLDNTSYINTQSKIQLGVSTPPEG